MGLPNWMHWLCWFLDGTISAAIYVMISVLLICVEWEEGMGRVIYYSKGFVIFLFFLLYAMSLILFMFAFSTLFSSGKFIYFLFKKHATPSAFYVLFKIWQITRPRLAIRQKLAALGIIHVYEPIKK